MLCSSSSWPSAPLPWWSSPPPQGKAAARARALVTLSGPPSIQASGLEMQLQQLLDEEGMLTGGCGGWCVGVWGGGLLSGVCVCGGGG